MPSSGGSIGGREIGAAVSAIAAMVALFLTGVAAKTARDQTNIHRQFREDAALMPESGSQVTKMGSA